jgi:hypothetical protein
VSAKRKKHCECGYPLPAWENEAVIQYWLAHYISPSGFCSLCANSGIVDTRGIVTASGVPTGQRNFCICPNGQAKRHYREEKT